ncbi:hypothetical protein [Ornithinimicrobium panacihumi]|uniref:hypothetical protein n=1 Tax=Ornithinimicrobium panacihumi TaxID=2008449 RepID=UPI003F8AEB46
MWIRDCRPWGGERSDVRIEGEAIAEVRAHDPAVGTAPAPGPGGSDVEGRGRILLPSFSDVHVHLDSTRLGLPFRPHTGAPGVWAMMLNDRAHWRDAEVGIVERVAHTLGLMIARGTTRVRSFAQVRADLLLVTGETPTAAVMDRLPDRTVLHRGRVVADQLELLPA